jgi:YHS domain-containing protein
MDMVEMELNILSEEKIKVIISRAKAKWQVAGGKEYSFCNLEKKHFTEKNFSKLVVENNRVIQDPKAILTEQTLFDEKLYKSSNPRHEELHNELFLNNDNPFISKPNQAEVYPCEGKITLQVH